MEGIVFQEPLPSPDEDIKNLVITPFTSVRENFLHRDTMEKFNYAVILQGIFGTLNGINKYLEVKAPWTLAKDPAKKSEMIGVLNTAAEVIRLSSLMLWPFIPQTSEEILKRLGQKTFEDLLKESKATQGSAFEKDLSWGQGKKASVTVGTPLFLRLT
jgi:methionyl-tRNA synthetase